VVVATAAGFSDVYGYDITDVLYYAHPTVCWVSDRVANALDWKLLTVEGWVVATYFATLPLFLITICAILCQVRCVCVCARARACVCVCVCVRVCT
jgi:hypothetical protein